ncbi:MAG TPA: outer membrane beta-barrel protein, partial [Candidatus Edwardsbacteria bacterium]|nr:outer membrane beta-barrel protein [Candidatus Edwardsbacteria bacterium]
IGYCTWSGKEEILGLKTSMSDIPIIVGGKYFFGNGNFKPYGTVELGFHMMTAKVEGTISYYGYSQSVSESSSESKMGFGLGAGAMMPMGEKMNLNGTIMYQSIATDGSSLNNIAIKVGIMYNL